MKGEHHLYKDGDCTTVMKNLFRTLLEEYADSAVEVEGLDAETRVTDEIEDAEADAFGEAEGAPEGFAATVSGDTEKFDSWDDEMDDASITNDNGVIDSDYHDDEEAPEATPANEDDPNANIDDDSFTVARESYDFGYDDLF